VGYKKEESDMLLNFLYDHIAFGADFQARVQWKPGMVVFWDVSLLFLLIKRGGFYTDALSRIVSLLIQLLSTGRLARDGIWHA
jgi:hypothetical protein